MRTVSAFVLSLSVLLLAGCGDRDERAMTLTPERIDTIVLIGGLAYLNDTQVGRAEAACDAEGCTVSVNGETARVTPEDMWFAGVHEAMAFP